MRPAFSQAPVAGSNSSAEPALSPPATSTRPSGNVVARCPVRPTCIGAAALHFPAVGSYSSADVDGLEPLNPPMSRTLPSSSAAAAGCPAGLVIVPAGDQVFVAAS